MLSANARKFKLKQKIKKGYMYTTQKSNDNVFEFRSSCTLYVKVQLKYKLEDLNQLEYRQLFRFAQILAAAGLDVLEVVVLQTPVAVGKQLRRDQVELRRLNNTKHSQNFIFMDYLSKFSGLLKSFV